MASPARSKAYAPVVELFAARSDSWVPISIIHGYVKQSKVTMSRQALVSALDRCVYKEKWLDVAQGRDLGAEYHQLERHYSLRSAMLAKKAKPQH